MPYFTKSLRDPPPHLLPHLHPFGAMRLSETYGFIKVPTHHNSPSYTPDGTYGRVYTNDVITSELGTCVRNYSPSMQSIDL